MGNIHRPPVIPKGKPVTPATPQVREPSPPVRAIEGDNPPTINKARFAGTTESVARSYGLGSAFAEHFHGVTESSKTYNPDNVSRYKKLYAHSQGDISAEKLRNVDPYWTKLSAEEKANVARALEDPTQPTTPDEALMITRLRDFWDYAQRTSGTTFDHSELPRPRERWTVSIRSQYPVPAGFEPSKSFAFESDAKDYANAMDKALNKTPGSFQVDVNGPINLSDLRTPGTEPIPPTINFKGEFPADTSPADGIMQASNQLLRYRYEQQVKDPVNAFRSLAQTDARPLRTIGRFFNRPETLTPEEFAKFDDQIRRDVYGTRGSSSSKQFIDKIEGPLRRGINNAARAAGAKQEVVTSPTSAIADSMAMFQHALQLTTPSENFNRYAENFVQIAPETHDIPTYFDVSHSLNTTKGRAWLTATQDSMAVSRPLVDPRVDDPERSGTARAISKSQNVMMAGHQLGTDNGIKIGVGNAYAYYEKHGFTPELIVRYDADRLRETFPELSTREAWNRVLSNLERIEEEAWTTSEQNPDAGSFSELKRQGTVDYLTVTLGPDAFEYPSEGDWAGRPLDLSTLTDQGMIPLGGHAMNGAQLFLIKNTYLRWPGYQTNIETYAPNTTRILAPYQNPSFRHREHVYSMLKQWATGQENQIDPGMREALVQQTMLSMAVQKRLPFTYWLLNRTIVGGARLPLNVYNGAKGTGVAAVNALGANIDDSPVDLTSLAQATDPETATNIYDGALAGLGMDFTGGDMGMVPGERRSYMFGMPPDEQHDTFIRVHAEYALDAALGSASPVAIGVAISNGWNAQNKTDAAINQFGLLRSLNRAKKGYFKEPITDAQGMTVLDRDFKPPNLKSAGKPLPEDSPAGVPIPLTQRFADLSPARRVFWMQIAEEAYQRMQLIDREAAQAQLNADTKTLTTPGPVQASKLEHLRPVHEMKEMFGYRPTTQTSFEQKHRDIINREPMPISPSVGTSWLDNVLRSESKFQKQVVADTEKAARMYLRGEAPKYPGYKNSFLSSKQLLTSGTIAVRMDKATADNIASGLVNDYARGHLQADKLNKLREPQGTSTRPNPAGFYGTKDAIVQQYSDLIMTTYNRELNRSQNLISR